MRRIAIAVAVAVLLSMPVRAADEAETPSPDDTLRSYLTSNEPEAGQKDLAVAVVKKAQMIELYYEHDTPMEDPAEAAKFALSMKASCVVPETLDVDGKKYARIRMIFSPLLRGGEKLAPEQWLDEMKRPLEAGYRLAAVEVVLTPSTDIKRESFARSKEAVKALAKALEESKAEFPQLKELAATSVIEGRWDRGDWPRFPHLHYEHAIGPDRKGPRERLADDWCSVFFGFHVITGGPSQRPSTGARAYPLQGIAAVWTVQSGNEDFNKQFNRIALAALAPLDDLEAELRGGEAGPEPIMIRGEEYFPIPDKEMRAAGFDAPELSREDNAAFVYYEAINACWEPESGSDLARMRDGLLAGRWSEDSSALAEYLARNEKALDLARQAASRPACFFPIMARRRTALNDLLLPGAPTPYPKGMRELARLCVVYGRKLEFDGHPDKALESYLLVLRLGNHASCGPTMVDGIVGIACNTLALRAIESCILRNELDEQTLASVQKQLHAIMAQRPKFSSAVRNEKAHTRCTVEYIIRDPGLFTGGEEAWRDELATYNMTPEQWEDMVRGDFAAYWEAVDSYLDMPLPELLAAEPREKLDELVNVGEGERPMNLMSLLGLTFRGPLLYGKADLYWTVVDVEMALARYKATRGRYPAALDELGPLMRGDGLDPFSGKLLHYRLEDDGSFTIWSVGANLVDDGGKLLEKHAPWRNDDPVWNSRLIASGPAK